MVSDNFRDSVVDILSGWGNYYQWTSPEEQREEFKYPGSIISSDGDTIHNICTWMNAVWTSVQSHPLQFAWNWGFERQSCSQQPSMASWTARMKHKQAFHWMEMCTLRWIIGILWDRTMNGENEWDLYQLQIRRENCDVWLELLKTWWPKPLTVPKDNDPEWHV